METDVNTHYRPPLADSGSAAAARIEIRSDVSVFSSSVVLKLFLLEYPL
jgi:hypothetical protein